MKRRMRVGVGILAVVCGVTGALGRDRIERVAVRDLDGHAAAPGDVLSFVQIRAGREFDMSEVSRDVRSLLDTGRFQYVEARADPGAEGGLVVTFHVRRRLRLTDPVGFEGHQHFRERRLREWVGLQPGDFVDEHRLAVRADAVRRQYEAAYFPDARVEEALEVLCPTGRLARARITIREGSRARIRDVEFEGNQVFSRSVLLERVGQRRWWDPWRWFRKRRYDEHELEAARIALRDAYLNRGYLDVQVDPPEVTRADRRVRLRFDIAEGAPYTVAEVTVSGVEQLPELSVRSAVGLRPGDAAARAAVQSDTQSIRNLYALRGYVDTRVRPVVEPTDAPGRVRVRYDIQEGVLTRIRNIEIRGNTQTRDKVIRREIPLSPGDLLDEVRVQRTEQRLLGLRYFSSVRSYDLPTPTGDVRDLVFEVEEQRTGQFMIGAGFSSIDNLIGFLELSQGNFDIANWPVFSGGGQKLRASMELGSRRRNYEIEFTEPWLMNRRLSLQTSLYQRFRRYREYEEQRLGSSLDLTRGLWGVGRIGVRYTLENIRLDDLPEGRFVFTDNPEESYRFTDEAGRYTASRLRLSWNWDTRNRVFVPTRGFLLSAFAGLAGGPLGFDAELYETGLGARVWMPVWRGHVFSLRARGDVVDTLDGSEPVISERLFLGGGRTLRGFGFRGVGPKVRPEDGTGRTYRPVGGRTMILGSAEYTVPVFPVLRVAAFCDAGNLWREAFEADVTDLAVSGGFGLRIDIPGFPIRLDYAWVLREDDPITETSRWVIWVGYD